MPNQPKRGYDAVIPADVRYDNTLAIAARMMYGEIRALCNERGYCWASNDYFAKLYDKNSKTVSEWISSLAKAGYIIVEIDQANGNSRKIFIADSKVKSPIYESRKAILSQEKSKDLSRKIGGGSPQKLGEGIPKKPEYNSVVNTKNEFPSPARSEQAGVTDDEGYYQKAKASHELQSRFIKDRGIPIDKYLTYLNDFREECQAKEKTHSNYPDYCSHFLVHANAKWKRENRPAKKSGQKKHPAYFRQDNSSEEQSRKYAPVTSL